MTASFELERSIPVQRVDPPLPPGWIVAILGEDAKEIAVSGARDPAMTVTESTDFSFLRVRAANLRNLADDAFRSAVRRSYTSIVTLLDERHLFPLRVWNHIPGILDPASGGLHRYEHFNAGRFDAYREYHGHECFGERSPSASAVGCGGDDLMIDLLAGSGPGVPADNPRQIPPYRYSARYGPIPPCFSRATVIEQSSLVSNWGRFAITSGTASIVGEDSRHQGDLSAQIRETCLNLAILSASLAGERVPTAGDEKLADPFAERALARYRELRCYVVREGDLDEVADELCRTFRNLSRLEVGVAKLCRPELLVEAEGLLSLDG